MTSEVPKKKPTPQKPALRELNPTELEATQGGGIRFGPGGVVAPPG